MHHVDYICSRHEDTVKKLQKEFPDAKVIVEADAETIAGKVVVGNLPLFLAAFTAIYGNVSRARNDTDSIRINWFSIHKIPFKGKTYEVR